MIFSPSQKLCSTFSWVCLCLLVISFHCTANMATADELKPKYIASTANNLLIDTDELNIALIPLTKDELNIEAIAWFNLVKDNATIVSRAEILVNQDKRRIVAAEKISEISKQSATLSELAKSDQVALEKLKNDIEEIKQITKSFNQEKAIKTVNEMTTSSESLNKLAEKAGDFKKTLQHEREYLIKNLTLLRSNKNNALARFQLVVEAWELKGGDTKDFKLYAEALSGTNINLTDSDAAWLTVHGWFFSKDGGIRWITNIIKFAVALLIVSILSMSIGKIVDSAVNRNKKVSTLLKQFIAVSVRRVILIIGFIMSLTLIEINVAPLLALIGAAGLVVGLALQGTLSNFASGMLILIYRPFDVGDIITTDGVSGTVHSMTLLSTSVRTFDNQHLIVPNNSIWGSTITNVTGSKTRRVDLIFGIGYGDDITKAETIMRKIVDNHPLVLKSPEPVIKVNELGNSSVNFVCRPWVKTENYRNVFWDITRQVKEEFTKQGVTIPFPQQDVHVYNVANNTLDSAQKKSNDTFEFAKKD